MNIYVVIYGNNNVDCCILLLDLDKRGIRIYKNIILYFYSPMVTLVWSQRAIGESLHTQRSCQESEQPVKTDFN